MQIYDQNMLTEGLNGACEAGLLNYKADALLSEYCTFKIGGPADFVIHPCSLEGLRGAIQLCRRAGADYRIFGNGSNLVFPDEGIRGAVIFTTAMKGLRADGDTVYAEAGVTLSALSSAAQKNALTGLEFAYGIPGSVGGGVYMNAGAFNGEIKDSLISSTYYDAELDCFCELSAEEHNFAYRHSAYMHGDRVIVAATFRLNRGDAAEIKESMDFYWQRRVEKQPLEYPSAGSVFKRYQGFFTAKLIEDAGLKGLTVGGAQVSVKHSGFIINIGGATAKDVKDLVAEIRRTIYEKNQIDIECEIRFIAP